MSAKRQRSEVTVSKKYEIVTDLELGSQQSDVPKKFGINESTASKKNENISQFVLSSKPVKRTPSRREVALQFANEHGVWFAGIKLANTVRESPETCARLATR